MEKQTYYLIATLIAAAVTIVPKVIPLFFLRGKTFNKKLIKFFKIIPYTSMTILILREILTANSDMKFMFIITTIISVIVSYITENMIFTVFSAIIITFIYLKLF